MLRLLPHVKILFYQIVSVLIGVLVVNEILDLAERRKDVCIIIKLDFKRTYGTVSWGFLSYMIQRLGFNGVWRRKVEDCTCSTSISVPVNGNPREEFKVEKDHGQGYL